MPHSVKKHYKKASAHATNPRVAAAKAVVAPSTYQYLYRGTLAAFMVYFFALWAIDSGSLWAYACAFGAFYYTVHFYRLFARNKFFNNDKAISARPAKK
jgi:hypothetical protein